MVNLKLGLLNPNNKLLAQSLFSIILTWKMDVPIDINILNIFPGKSNFIMKRLEDMKKKIIGGQGLF